MKKLIKLIPSPKLTLWLLVIMAIFFYIGTTNIFNDPTNRKILSTRIFYSPTFLAITLLFFLNLAICTFRQFKSLKQEACSTEFPVKVRTFPVITQQEKEALLPQIRELLRSKGFKTISNSYGFPLYAYKGTIGRWGSLVFHLGILIIILGALIQLTFDFTGFLGMAEGDTFIDNRENYSVVREGFLGSREFGQFKLFLQQVNIKSQKTRAQAEGLLTLIQDEEIVKRQWLGQGHPLSYGLMNIYYDRMGYFINVIIQRHGKSETYPVRLDTSTHALSEEYKGHLTISSSNYNITVILVPDLTKEQSLGTGVPRTMSYEPKNPAGFIVVTKAGNNGARQKIYSGTVPLGQKIVLAGEEKLVLDSVIPWITLYVKNQFGLYIAYAGLTIATVGVCMLYLFVYQALVVIMEPCENRYHLILKSKRPKFTVAADSYNSLGDRINELMAAKKQL